MAEVSVRLDPDQSFPECPYSYKGWMQYEESICHQAYQRMKDEGWARIIKVKIVGLSKHEEKDETDKSRD